MTKSIFSALVIVAMFTMQAFAGTGADGYFNIHNDTTNNKLIGFYTDDGGGLSANWLDGYLEAGFAVTVEFNADTGSCAQELTVGWESTNGGEVLDDPISIDICDASDVYLGDNEIIYE